MKNRYTPPEKEDAPREELVFPDPESPADCAYCMGTGAITTELGYIKTCYRCEGTGIDPDGS